MNLHCERWSAVVDPLTEGSVPEDTRSKVVLVHGLAGTGAVWRPVAVGLQGAFDVLAPDQRGHGKSRLTGDQSLWNSQQFTPKCFGQDLIDTLEANRFYPSWWVGHSMGVRSVLAAALIQPLWVQGLILVDLGLEGLAGGGLGSSLGDFVQILPEKFESVNEARLFIRSHCPDPAIGQYLMAVSIRRSDGSLEFPFDHAALTLTIEAAKNSSIRKWVRTLGEMGKPVHLLRGATSRVWSAAEFDKEAKALEDLPCVKFHTFEGAGHGLPFEKRTEFVNFIKEVAN